MRGSHHCPQNFCFLKQLPTCNFFRFIAVNWVKMRKWIQKSKYGFSGSKRAHFLWFRVLQCNICKMLAFLGQIIILCTILVNWGSIWAKFQFLSFGFFLLKYYPFSKSDASILKRPIFQTNLPLRGFIYHVLIDLWHIFHF